MVNEPRIDGRTPLGFAAVNGHVDTIRWWIASGREMDLGKPGDVYKTDAIEGAMENRRMEIATLLERFKSDASKTRHAVRVKLGFLDDLAADVRPGGLCLGWITATQRHDHHSRSQVLLPCRPASS